MPSSKKIELEPIGFVKRMPHNMDTKDRSALSRIVIRTELVDALEGIDGFSHIFVLFWLHKIRKREATILKVHPRGKLELPLLGVFSTRAPVRPNPIGLTLVELKERRQNILSVKGLDAVDGTPVLDIKPYDNWDIAVGFKVPKWLTKLDSQSS